MIARVIYKNKSGWKTGKHTFVKGTEEQINAYAIKESRGREFKIQPIELDNIPSHWKSHIKEVR